MTEIIATADDVRAVYRLVLGRDPDPVGLADHMSMIADGTVTTTQLLAMFIGSAEYVAKHECKVDIGGAVLIVDATEPEFGQHIARDATWEPHIVATIRNHLRPGNVFVDIGANVGVMSLYAAIAVGPQGKVISFEPDENNARCFLRGVFESKFQDYVRLYRFALSDGQAIFALAGGSNANLTPAKMPSRIVQTIQGDDVLFHEPRIDFIKLDIEGYEPFALRGMGRTLTKHKPLILCEFNPRCLISHASVPPERFAKQIFDITTKVGAIEHDGQTNCVTTPTDLMNLWKTKNKQAIKTGFLPPGMLHFDLLFRVTR
jgi:FkbM family methyltransferase